MLIAHLPSGYLLGVALVRPLGRLGLPAGLVMVAAMLGAVAPDFDLIFQHLVADAGAHHHAYPTHWPLPWLAVAACSGMWLAVWNRSRAAMVLLAFSLGGALHVGLDAITGKIRWLAPFSTEPFVLFEVPGKIKPWWLNCMLHWSFALELAICLGALLLWRKRTLARRMVTSDNS